VVQILLRFNADPMASLHTGYTALHVCTLLAFQQKPYLLNIYPQMAAENGHAQVCELLVDLGMSNVNAVDRYGRTPLGSVVAYCKRNPEETIEALLQRGAKINGELDGNIRDPPLVLAAQQGRDRMVQLLLERGADHRPADSEGFTALHVAWKYPSIVKMLVEAGTERALLPHLNPFCSVLLVSLFFFSLFTCLL